VVTSITARPIRRFRLPRLGLGSIPIGSTVILIGLVLLAIAGPFLTPYDPLKVDLSVRLMPPALFGGSWAHPLGTDDAGRDILTRIMFGARISLLIAASSLILGGGFGTIVGLIAGFRGGATDSILMRIADLTISYPIILLALLLSAAFGPQIWSLIGAIAFIFWARFARIVRGEVLVIRELPYIALARIAGAPTHRIVRRHVLPNVANTIMVLSSLQLGQVIVIEASLSFLGAGVPPPEPAWGSMIAQGLEFVNNAWWVPTVPGIAISITVLGFNLFGNWLRDRLDPRVQAL